MWGDGGFAALRVDLVVVGGDALDEHGPAAGVQDGGDAGVHAAGHRLGVVDGAGLVGDGPAGVGGELLEGDAGNGHALILREWG